MSKMLENSSVSTLLTPIVGNVTSVAEYLKVVTTQQLRDRIRHIIDMFLRIMQISRLKYNS